MFIFNAQLCNSLEKIFKGDSVFPAPIKNAAVLVGQRFSFQLAVRINETADVSFDVKSEIPCKAYRVREIHSDYPIGDDRGNTAVVNNAQPGDYPDLLEPTENTIEVEKDSTAVIWFELCPTAGGEYPVDVSVECGDISRTLTLTVSVADKEMPAQTLKHINWFHTDCLASYYNVPVFSEEYWRITENFARCAIEHGVNVLFTPLFTPPLDTEEGGERPTVQLVKVTKKRQTYLFDFTLLDRWVEMAHRVGFEYFELSHLFTQWGAKNCPKIITDTLQGERRIFGWETKSESDEYVSFLRQFGAALTEYTDKKGITDKCYIHCSDEPGAGDKGKYKKCSSMIRSYFGAYKHIDALSEYSFYKAGLVDVPVPSESEVLKFVGKVPELWTYYCCGPYKDNYPNRFFALPSVKNRVLGTLLYKYEIVGFLHWGYNFYFTQYSKGLVDPFKVSDAGGKFPSGDSYIVYPAKDGTPLSSLRQKVFYDGFQDYENLKLLEKLTSRENVLELIEEKLGDISFTSYPLDTVVFTSFTDSIAKAIAEAEK